MTKGIVKAIIENLVQVKVSGPVSQNEICYINLGGVKLMAEVIKYSATPLTLRFLKALADSDPETKWNSRNICWK